MLYEKYKVEPSDQLAFNLDTRSLWLETIAWIEANPEAFSRLAKYAINEYERGGKASSRSWAARERFDNRISIRNEMTPILSRICEQYCGVDGVFTQSKSVYDGVQLNENERAEMKAYLGW